MVYETGHKVGDEVEIEMISEQLFRSEQDAVRWYNESCKGQKFINPQPVKLSGLNKLVVSPSHDLHSVKKNKFLGKTIQRMDTTAVNEVIFYFTDGTSTSIEVEAMISSMGLYGMVSREAEDW